MIVYASMSMCVFVPLYFHDLHIVYMNVHADTEREREKESSVQKLVRQAERLERFFDVEHLPEARTTGCSFIKLPDSGSLINRKLLAWYLLLGSTSD